MSRDRSVLIFLLVTLCGALPAVVAVLSNDKLALHAMVNAEHNALADQFFKWFTHLGDGLVPTAIALLVLFTRDLRSFIMVGGAAGSSAMCVQLLKRQVFPGMDRPAMFRESLTGMHWVDGIELHNHFSFPSGHSTAAFSTCLALAILFGRPAWAFALAFLACTLAYSRVYLSQHFTQDVLAGALLGVGAAVLLYLWLYRSSFALRPWLDRGAFRYLNQ